MKLKLLRTFLQLAASGHYGKASAKLFVTQSTLSKQMQALESEVGGPLFERGRHGAKLTPLGQLLQQEARTLLRLNDDIDRKMQRAIAGLTGCLDIGFGISTLVVAPRLIAGFRATTPDSPGDAQRSAVAETTSEATRRSAQYWFLPGARKSQRPVFHARHRRAVGLGTSPRRGESC